ncbi:hypothetical protein ZWY2020_025835 [Hordeum vulgare]|nr:hypothetical protein ZWY2020_025835 [Hordeum vulgare]
MAWLSLPLGRHQGPRWSRPHCAPCGVPYPCSAVKFRLGMLPSRKSRAAVSTTRSPGLGNTGNLREVRSCKDAGILV